MYLVEEISRQNSTESVGWILLVALIQICHGREQNAEKKDIKNTMFVGEEM